MITALGGANEQSIFSYANVEKRYFWCIMILKNLVVNVLPMEEGIFMLENKNMEGNLKIKQRLYF